VEDGAVTCYSAITTHEAVTRADPDNGSGIIYGLSRHKMRDVLDGTSNTLAVGENYSDYDTDHKDWLATFGPAYCPSSNCFLGKMWSCANFITTAHGINRHVSFNDSGVESFHPGGAQFGLVDGSVRFINDSIDQATLEALTTREGGETIGEF
jgi:prepilin-type processing-associated H-X9-DG protein